MIIDYPLLCKSLANCGKAAGTRLVTIPNLEAKTVCPDVSALTNF
jgi:hypothetical protein